MTTIWNSLNIKKNEEDPVDKMNIKLKKILKNKKIKENYKNVELFENIYEKPVDEIVLSKIIENMEDNTNNTDVYMDYITNKITETINVVKYIPYAADKQVSYYVRQFVLTSSNIDLSYIDISNINILKNKLLNMDLSEIDLSGIDLSGIDLTGIDLSGINLSNMDLSGIDLSGVNISNIKNYINKGINELEDDVNTFVSNAQKFNETNNTNYYNDSSAVYNDIIITKSQLYNLLLIPLCYFILYNWFFLLFYTKDITERYQGIVENIPVISYLTRPIYYLNVILLSEIPYYIKKYFNYKPLLFLLLFILIIYIFINYYEYIHGMFFSFLKFSSSQYVISNIMVGIVLFSVIGGSIMALMKNYRLIPSASPYIMGIIFFLFLIYLFIYYSFGSNFAGLFFIIYLFINSFFGMFINTPLTGVFDTINEINKDIYKNIEENNKIINENFIHKILNFINLNIFDYILEFGILFVLGFGIYNCSIEINSTNLKIIMIIILSSISFLVFGNIFKKVYMYLQEISIKNKNFNTI